MDEIEKRLRETSDKCISSYDAWRKDQKNGEVREDLMEAVHELRKVAARLEIEIAISERDEMAARPIPIPPHRASRKQRQEGGNDDNFGNVAEDSNGNTDQAHMGQGGGGGGGGGNRDRGGHQRRGGGGGRR